MFNRLGQGGTTQPRPHPESSRRIEQLAVWKGRYRTGAQCENLDSNCREPTLKMKLKSLARLEKAAARRKAIASDLETLAAAPDQLRAEVDSIVNELAGIDLSRLVLLGDLADLDPATANKLQRLRFLRDRIEIIPGVVSKLERDAEALEAEIAGVAEAAQSELRDAASELVRAVRAKAEAELSKMFKRPDVLRNAVDEFVWASPESRAAHIANAFTLRNGNFAGLFEAARLLEQSAEPAVKEEMP